MCQPKFDTIFDPVLPEPNWIFGLLNLSIDADMFFFFSIFGWTLLGNTFFEMWPHCKNLLLPGQSRLTWRMHVQRMHIPRSLFALTCLFDPSVYSCLIRNLAVVARETAPKANRFAQFLRLSTWRKETRCARSRVAFLTLDTEQGIINCFKMASCFQFESLF